MGRAFLLVSALLGLASAELHCNTTLHVVPGCIAQYGCPPERTCQNFRGPEPPCLPSPGPCRPLCVCAEGYARNKYAGMCVILSQCDKCPNNEYFTCDGDYDENCDGSCHCVDGFKRDSDNVCVSTYVPPPVTHKPPPYPPGVGVTAQPPNKPKKCDRDSATLHEISACGYGCPPELTCQNRNLPPFPCAPPAFPCTEKCVCAGLWPARNKEGGTCVTLEQCDKCPGENEYFECDGDYDENCDGHCYCLSGYTRDINGTCVYVDPAAPPKDLDPPTTEAPVVTTEGNQGLNCNATLHEVPGCDLGCPPQRTCQNFRGPEPPCLPPREPCKPQCVCADGYARNKYGGQCVTFAQCDKCPGNGQYFTCGGEYNDNCVGSCHCTDGYERDSNNTCVSTYVPPPIAYNPPPPPVNPSVTAQPPHPIDPPKETEECNPPEIAIFYNL